MHRRYGAEHSRPAEAAREPDETQLRAADFRELMADHERQEVLRNEAHLRSTAEQRRLEVAELIDHHILDENRRSLWHEARHAAERAEKEFLLLRFRSQLCSDVGRAIILPSQAGR